MSENKQMVAAGLTQAEPWSALLSLLPMVIRPASPARKALTLVGAALVFAGREIVPRVVVSLLDAWDRRTGSTEPAAGVSEVATPLSSAHQPVTRLPETARKRYQRRRRVHGS